MVFLFYDSLLASSQRLNIAGSGSTISFNFLFLVEDRWDFSLLSTNPYLSYYSCYDS